MPVGNMKSRGVCFVKMREIIVQFDCWWDFQKRGRLGSDGEQSDCWAGVPGRVRRDTLGTRGASLIGEQAPQGPPRCWADGREGRGW